MSLYGYRVEDLIGVNMEAYEVPYQNSETVADSILKYLTSSPGFIQHKRAPLLSEGSRSKISDALHLAVSKGAPIEVFITAFSPKFKKANISNGQIYPDMADFLTLIHLQLIAQSIQQVYPYGFRFIVAYKGRLLDSVGCWGEKNIMDSFRYLQELNGVAEKITGARRSVKLYDLKDLLETVPDYDFRLKNEIRLIQDQYVSGDCYFVKKIDAWVKDYLDFVDPQDFNGDITNEVMVEKAIAMRAHKHIRFDGGQHNRGICSSFPHVLQVETRGDEKTISLQLNPYFRFHSHQGLMVRRNGQWFIGRWSEIRMNFHAPVYVSELPYPLYYDID